MNLLQIFTTPVWEAKLPEFEKHKHFFIKCVQAFREKYPESVNKSNMVGGYQSPINLTKETELAPLFDFICNFGMKASFDLQFTEPEVFMTSAWVNFYDSPHDMLLEHVHADTFTGVFYLEAPEDSGKLVLSNPGLNPVWQGCLMAESKNKFTSEKLQITPSEGTVFLWPSYIPHKVLPNKHNNSRISISFSLIAMPKGRINEIRG